MTTVYIWIHQRKASLMLNLLKCEFVSLSALVMPYCLSRFHRYTAGQETVYQPVESIRGNGCVLPLSVNLTMGSAPIISLLLDHPGPDHPLLTSSSDLHPSYNYYWTILDRSFLCYLHHEICTHHISATGPSCSGPSSVNLNMGSAPII